VIEGQMGNPRKKPENPNKNPGNPNKNLRNKKSAKSKQNNN
jgi:hypothetical protein